VLGVLEVEAAASLPLRALVAMGGDASGRFSIAPRCMRFQVAKVVLRLVKSFSGPPEPGSR
jgi:hypothetical protein